MADALVKRYGTGPLRRLICFLPERRSAQAALEASGEKLERTEAVKSRARPWLI